MTIRFLLRWSMRDLRRRWLQVAAIALIIGIGTGVYSALGSTATWRRRSNDSSFERLAMYDLRVAASVGGDARQGEMLAALDRLPEPSVVVDAEERLVLPTQVDASKGAQAVLVPGRIVGVDLSDGGPHTNRLWVGPGDGRGLGAQDEGRPSIVLERKFAEFYDLPPAGTIDVGGRSVEYVGVGSSPEYFIVLTEEAGFFAEANFAVVFTSIHTAQDLTGRPGRVNDLVVRLRPGVDPAAVASDLERAFATAGLAVTVTDRADEDAYRVLYDDIESDQQFWNVFAGLILAGAAFGAFNLATRMVEAQRRELGVGMAIGLSTARLALRPLLVGAEIALLGVVFGAGVGVLVVAALEPVFRTYLPLPVWITGLSWRSFATGATLGFLVPLVATAWPVWRAVRVMPVDAIVTTHRSARGGLAPLLRRLPWPRGAFARMPIGNVLRTPRRTVLTALGIGAAVTALVGTLGMVDSLFDMMERNDRELLRGAPGRLVVALDDVYPETAPAVTVVAGDDTIGSVQPVLRVPAIVRRGRTSIDVMVEALDLAGGPWRPSTSAGSLVSPEPGILLSEKAIDDLGVAVGDIVSVRHPAFTGDGVTMVESRLPISGTHRGPLRISAYVDRSFLGIFGAAGLTNELFVVPAAGSSTEDVQRALFGAPAVASAQPVAATTQVVRDAMAEFVSVFRVLVGFIFLLAVLIAYNTASISTDERAREHATLFAFGLPPARVVRMDVLEHLVMGALGTAAGMAGGVAVLHWITSTLLTRTLPDVGFAVAPSSATIALAVALGLLAVAAAPLLTVRRLRRMDVPATLRIVE